jgi:CheY-like chemotaxis protein
MAKKGSILVCDDEEIMRDVLETILSGAGYKVDLAKTGEEALRAYEEKPYDVVLMDVSMPGIGGLTTLEEIIKMDAEAVVLMITCLRNFRHGDFRLGQRCRRLYSQAFSKRTNPRSRRARHQNAPQRRRARFTAPGDDAFGQARRDYRAFRKNGECFSPCRKSRTGAFDCFNNGRVGNGKRIARQINSRIQPSRRNAFCRG